ncbi:MULTISPECIES: DUF4376 domain-containing protein [unclassified Variovorax]|jgi:hypothetical protein|uniref:DUF4376 domain-containing protein n=2 Tax=Variovorax TaxID=34072 RepID=UPI0010F7D246|nr:MULTISPECIES: DUF4376 domain-containing protein [unclassified Variovorax]
MKYALYLLSNLQVIQWQDTDASTYPDVESWQGRIELEEPLPPEFDPYATPTGYWVVDGLLTNVAPPPPLSDVAMYATWAVSGKRVSLIAEGVELAGGRRFRPTDADLARVGPIALQHTALGVSSIDIQLDQPPTWYAITAADLETAYAAFIVKREQCFSNERVHLEAIAMLLAANDRPGLEGYDTTTGWPS